MEIGDKDVLLAEALTTNCRCKRRIEAKRALEYAHGVASRCCGNGGRTVLPVL